MASILNLALLAILTFIIPVNQIKIPEHQKILNSFSGNLNDGGSFHLILTKNKDTKNYDILTYTHNDKGFTELPSVSFEKKLGILSFHSNGEAITLIVKSKIDGDTSIQVLDFNQATEHISKSKPILYENYKTIIREDHKNTILFVKDGELKTMEILSAENIVDQSIELDYEAKKFMNDLEDEGLTPINTDEYVKNGSIKSFKAYSENGEIIITQDDQSTGFVNLLKLSMSSEKIVSSFSSLKSKPVEKYKKNSSYFIADKIYQLKMGKKDAKLNVFQADGSSKRTIDLLGTKVLENSSNREAAENFSKKASRNANHPTITLNETKQGAFKIRLDYVNKNTYNYNYHWWWHHHWMMQQQMMIHQQMHQNAMRNMSRFGPNSNEDHAAIYNLNSIAKQSHFELGITANGELIDPKDLKTKKQEIDKQKIIKQIEDDKKLKHSSTVFYDDHYIYFAFAKKQKSFKLIRQEYN
ncbi:MAG: hypothetical protein WBG46_15440 [Nonlabens sp.]